MREVTEACARCGKPVATYDYGMTKVVDGVRVGIVIKDGVTADPGKLYHFKCYALESADLPWRKKVQCT